MFGGAVDDFNSPGIRVMYGEHGKERDVGCVNIKHVQTKNGVLTVVNKVK